MKYLLPFILIFSCISFAFAQELPKDLVASMPAVSAWKPGDSAAPLQKLEAFAFELKPDAAERAPLEIALCKAFEDATTNEAKTFLGKMLRVVGTERCIPQVEKSLTDPIGSHGARLVLGHLDSPKAAKALHSALMKSEGNVQVGIIDSIGHLRHQASLEDLVQLSKQESSAAVAVAAIRAIGRIGGGKALAALEGMSPDGLDAVRAHQHALLRACESANANQARPVYQRLFSDDDKRMKLAGLRGLVRCAPAEAPDLLAEAMMGDDPLLSATAVALLAESGDAGTTKRFAAMLKDLPAATQVPVLRALSERGDPAAADAVMERMKNGDDTVRNAALQAIATLGTGKHVPTLLDIATTGPGEREARSSLATLSGDGVDAALAAAVKTGTAERRVTAIRAAATRGADIADVLLGGLSGESDDTVRKEAILALSGTAKAKHAPAILQQAALPANREYTAGFERAITALQRKAGENSKLPQQILRSAKQAETAEARATMIRFLDITASEEGLALVAKESAAEQEAVRDAAVRTLAGWPNPAALPSLFTVAKNTSDEVHKALSLRAIVRLAETSDKPEAAYIDAMDLAKTAAEQKTVLGGLAAANSTQALKLVTTFIDQEEVRDEAALAAIAIGERVASADPQLVRSVVATVKEKVANKTIRQRAQNIVNELDKYDGYLLSGVWHVSPAYDLKGKDSRKLWEHAFAPESGDRVKWSPLTKGFNNYACDLGGTYGNKDNTAAYIRTSLWSETERKVRMEVGSDDACKIWLNGKEAHTFYGSRGTSPGSDKAEVTLKKGWNPVMMKVVNIGGGWGFAMRFRQSDGSRLEGLKFDPAR